MPLLKENHILQLNNEISIKKVVGFIESKYNCGEYIYPSAIHRKLKIELKLIYLILEQAVKSELLEEYMQLYCYHCQKYAGKLYKCIGDIPETEFCQNCDEEIVNPYKYTVVIYRVK